MGIDFAFNLENSWIKKDKVESLICQLENNRHINEDLTKEFLKFIFTIPSEDQNVEFNKIALAEFYNYLDVNYIFLKEYSEGRNFKDYFECLKDNKTKKEIVGLLKNSNIKK